MLFIGDAVEFLHAVRTEAVREGSFRMIVEVRFKLVPVPFVIPNFLAVRTDWNEAAKDFDPGE